MSYRKYDTCFFERYAMTALRTLLGHKFDDLVNEDRPDLQSSDGRTLGIEVTRAMEEGRLAAQQMLKDIAGVSHQDPLVEDSGYSYGVRDGRYIGGIELEYWKTALPMKKIIKSKVSKVTSGFYGDFREFGLFVFSKDPLSEKEALGTLRFTMDLQKYADKAYARLFLFGVDTLFACNLEDGLSMDHRITEVAVDQQLRREFFLESLQYE